MAIKITNEDELRRKNSSGTARTQVQATPAPQASGNGAEQVNTYTPPNSRYTPSAAVTEANNYLKQMRDGGYNKQWSTQLDALVNEYMGRGAFSYDPESDALWQQAKSQGLAQGKLAMKDAMASAAALSGGYGNSYAATVGNQVYQQAVADTMALQPQYIQAAYERYRNEGDDMLQKIGVAQSMDDAAYQRYMNELDLAQSEADRLYRREYSEFSDAWNRDYQTGRDAVTDSRYDTEWQRQLERDAVEDQRYDTQWQHQLDREGIEDQWRNTEWQHQLDREGIEDQWRNTEWQHQQEQDRLDNEYRNAALAQEQAQFDANMAWEKEASGYTDWLNAQEEETERIAAEEEAEAERTADFERIMSSPKFASTYNEIVGDYMSNTGVNRTEFIAGEIYDRWISEEFGNGTDALLYVEALAEEFGIPVEDILGRE